MLTVCQLLIKHQHSKNVHNLDNPVFLNDHNAARPPQHTHHDHGCRLMSSDVIIFHRFLGLCPLWSVFSPFYILYVPDNR